MGGGLEHPWATAKLSLSLPHSFSQQIKARRHKKKVRSPQVRSPHASPSFSLSLLFLPFVFRGSCCNSADHQQLPFQRHLTLPNPRLSLHPDIANAHPPSPSAVSHQAPSRAKALLLRLVRDMFTELHPFKFKRFPPEPLFCCTHCFACLPPYG